MGTMSDLHLLAGEVKDELDSGAESLDETVDAVARHSTYPTDEIKWAYSVEHGETEASDSLLSSEYQERFGKAIELEDAGRYTNLLVEGEMVASMDPDTGELCVYQPGDEEPEQVFDLDV